jgi:hypothetical protein
VPSTSARPSLTLAFRRAEMTAFWIMTTGLLWVMLWLTAIVLGAGTPWVWGAAGLGVLLPGVVWSEWFELGIRAWNKGVKLIAAALRTYVLRVCYYLLFGALSSTGSSLDLELNADISRWVPRPRHAPDVHDGGPRGDSDSRREHGLLTVLRNPGKAWMVCLLPALLLLRLLRDEGQESALPSSTYTLY